MTHNILWEEIEALASKRRKEFTHFRPGQSIMSAIFDLSSELYDTIVGDFSIDCYYNDEKIDKCKAFVESTFVENV